ncbi:MAG: hypothetical protein OEN50_13130 [Deltaproteobacteria bacterium]|nr:hypothetical protein [Deltaproteobacteria bacterium]
MSSEAAAKAIRTAKWATTMTKWKIGFETNGKRLGSVKVKPIRRWQLVSFPGPAGRESAGIVDLMAIRKNHKKPKRPFKRGDLFEIILIQIKGGGAKRPDRGEIKRLRDVAKYYNARDVILAEWVKGRDLKFHWLVNARRDPKRAWGEVDPGVAFR